MNRATPSRPLGPRTFRRGLGLGFTLVLCASCRSEPPSPSPRTSPAAKLPIAPDPAAARQAPRDGREDAALVGAAPDAATPKDVASACGDGKAPDCPLQAWMKHPLSDLLAAGELEAVAAALEALASYAPPGPGYPYWRSISFDGASAARMFEVEPVHAACRGCHLQYLAKYKSEVRDRPLPALPAPPAPPVPPAPLPR